jgi:diadenosine tetraphosphate (Ap4A) HIT family hydrolase
MRTDCQLCLLAIGRTSAGFHELFEASNWADEVVGISGDLMVVLDVAPVVRGHALIVPHAHEKSFARRWVERKPQLSELLTALFQVLGRRGVVCEHGLGVHSAGAAGCVEHAHLHVIPTEHALREAFRAAGVQLRPVQNPGRSLLEDITDQYLYLRDVDGKEYLATGSRFPSQLVRRLVAQQHGEIFWSWRDYLHFADVIGTRGRIEQGREIYAGLKLGGC